MLVREHEHGREKMSIWPKVGEPAGLSSAIVRRSSSVATTLKGRPTQARQDTRSQTAYRNRLSHSCEESLKRPKSLECNRNGPLAAFIAETSNVLHDSCLFDPHPELLWRVQHVAGPVIAKDAPVGFA